MSLQVKVLVLCAVGAVSGLAGTATAFAQAAAGPIKFRPHRAVYDIVFDHSTPGSGVADMSGRMVYEMTGTPCNEYGQSMRFVTRMTNQEGLTQVNDLRTSSFEDLATHQLRFQSTQYENQQLAESSQGSAAPGNGSSFIEVKLIKPAKKTVKLPGDIYFPIQHSMALIEAARAGRHQFAANLYDGSDKGEKFYETSAMLGPRTAPGGAKVPASVKNGGELDASASWPIAIAYFEPGASSADALPTYELSYRIYENGVSTRLYLDYGDFAIRGELRELTFLDEGKCSSKPAAKR